MKPKQPVQKRSTTRPGSAKRGRPASAKKVLVAKPPGYESQTVKHSKKNSLALPQSIENEDIRQVKSVSHYDQDITPSLDDRAFERVDDEGQKYLNYKSISGMDNLPRYRQPTPPKIVSIDDQEVEEGAQGCGDCGKLKIRCRALIT